MGTYWVYTPGAWLFNGSAYYQFGKNKADKKVSAYMFSLKAGYKIDPKWSVSLGTDYLSGDPDSKKVSTFDPYMEHIINFTEVWTISMHRLTIRGCGIRF